MQTFVLGAGVSEVQGEIMEVDHSHTLHCVVLVSPKWKNDFRGNDTFAFAESLHIANIL